MEENLEEPLDRGQLAKAAGLSTRQLERLFRKYLNRSPARYYVELRLNRARLLLLQTNMSVIDVALACGFVSAIAFLEMLPRLLRQDAAEGTGSAAARGDARAHGRQRLASRSRRRAPASFPREIAVRRGAGAQISARHGNHSRALGPGGRCFLVGLRHS